MKVKSETWRGARGYRTLQSLSTCVKSLIGCANVTGKSISLSGRSVSCTLLPSTWASITPKARRTVGNSLESTDTSASGFDGRLVGAITTIPVDESKLECQEARARFGRGLPDRYELNMERARSRPCACPAQHSSWQGPVLARSQSRQRHPRWRHPPQRPRSPRQPARQPPQLTPHRPR